jgi:hypothetical protein
LPADRAGCDYRACTESAVAKLRFGDGTWSLGPNHIATQTYVHYCDTHASIVRRTFVTCDERRLAPAALATT